MLEEDTIEIIDVEDVGPVTDSQSLGSKQIGFIAAGAVLGAGIGALVMYYADPRLGHRRRVLVRDQLIHFKHVANRTARVSGQVVKDTLKGAAAEFYGRIRPERHLSDEKLIQRVRSEVGRSLHHPHQFQISAKDGVVTLLSAASDEDFDSVMERIEMVKGVKKVEFLPLT